MKPSKLRPIMALATTAVIAFTGSAQNLTETVTVEGKYTPEVIPADRLAILPNMMTLKAPESNMHYDRIGVNANFAPDALSMAATGWRASKAYDTSKGYLNLRVGSWLNSSLSAGFAPINNSNTRLNIYLQHNSTSLWKAWKGDAEAGIPAAAKRFRYDETLGANLSHKIKNAGTLDAQLQYHLGYFNYYGTGAIALKDGKIDAPTQTINDIFASARWTGTPKGRIQYGVNGDVRYFGYRSMYVYNVTDPTSSIVASTASLAATKGERETKVDLGGDVAYSLTTNSKIGVDLLYSGVINSIGNNVNRIRFAPGYHVTNKKYTLHICADMAVVANGKTKFRIAPDVRFTYRNSYSALSATIGGGTYLRTLAWMHQMDYYANPWAGCYGATYSPIDMALAYQLNPGGKWTLGVEAGWRTVTDESFGGLYQAYLNGNLGGYEGMESNKLHGFNLKFNGGYEFSRYFGIKGKFSWQPQHGNTGVLNGFDRPVVTVDISAESRPTDKLSLRLDYGLRAKRLLAAGNISRLNLGADYRITDKISVGAELNNLLNRHEMMLPDLPTEGFTAAAGVQIVF